MEIKQVDAQLYGQSLFTIDNAAFHRDFDLKSRSVQEEVDYLKNSEVFIAYETEKPIGLVAYETKQEYIELMSIAVIPEFQNKGTGKKLLGHVLNRVKGREVRLVTHPKNTPAIMLYLRYGFIICGWKDNYYGDGQPRLLLKLEGRE